MDKEDNLKKALEMLETDMLDEYPDMEGLPKHEFSGSYLEQMKEIEVIAENRIAKVTRRKRFLKIASILFYVFISLAGIGIINATIKKLISVEIVHYEKNADLIFHIDESLNPILNEIEDYYAPGWLPEGYEIYEEEIDSLFSSIRYKNEYSDMLVFQQTIIKENIPNLDNECITFENLTLSNGRTEAVYYQTANLHELLWTDGTYQYMLLGVLGKETLIQIAESIQLK